MNPRSSKTATSSSKRDSRAKVSPPPDVAAKNAKRSSSGETQRSKTPKEQLKTGRVELTLSQQQAKLRGFAAINLVRKGKSKTLTEAARSEGTTVRSIRKLLPAALAKRGPDGRIRVRAGDTYSARVDIVTASGRLNVTARGSRERDLAGLHRSAIFKVLGEKAAPSSLRQFRGKKVGGHKLVSDFQQLKKLALADVLGQLDALYASPEASS